MGLCFCICVLVLNVGLVARILVVCMLQMTWCVFDFWWVGWIGICFILLVIEVCGRGDCLRVLIDLRILIARSGVWDFVLWVCCLFAPSRDVCIGV